MNKVIWIVGDYRGNNVWDIMGATYTEKKAVSFCTKSTHFVAPLEMDKRLPDETLNWPGCYYPLAEGENRIPPVSLAKREKALAGFEEE